MKIFFLYLGKVRQRLVDRMSGEGELGYRFHTESCETRGLEDPAARADWIRLRGPRRRRSWRRSSIPTLRREGLLFFQSERPQRRPLQQQELQFEGIHSAHSRRQFGFVGKLKVEQERNSWRSRFQREEETFLQEDRVHPALRRGAFHAARRSGWPLP